MKNNFQRIAFNIRIYFENFYETALQQYDDVIYNLLNRFKYKYHIIKIDTGYCWMDCDERMFLACFELLRQYVEDELRTSSHSNSYRGYRCDTESDEIAVDLYFWHKFELSKLKTGTDYVIYDKIKTEKLNELIKIRPRLWT